MNIFLPYEDDIVKSVQSLDDVRLNKQILETYQLLISAIKEKNGEKPNGWYKHPIYVFYKDNIRFLANYGYNCCREYYYRFKKPHKLEERFNDYIHDFFAEQEPKFTPYYMEGSKGQPNYIRTTENVSALFQQKLIKKWEQDKAKGRQPKWTNRDVPEFYKKYLEEKND